MTVANQRVAQWFRKESLSFSKTEMSTKKMMSPLTHLSSFMYLILAQNEETSPKLFKCTWSNQQMSPPLRGTPTKDNLTEFTKYSPMRISAPTRFLHQALTPRQTQGKLWHRGHQHTATRETLELRLSNSTHYAHQPATGSPAPKRKGSGWFYHQPFPGQGFSALSQSV